MFSKVSVSTKLRRRSRPEIDPTFAHIKSREELLAFLKANPNEYNNYMLLKMQEKQRENKEEGDFFEHHVIPKHKGGLDDDWNLVYLLAEEHKTAHELRLKVYNDPGDKDALKLLSKIHLNSKNAASLAFSRALMSHKKCRENKTGFFSPFYTTEFKW